MRDKSSIYSRYFTYIKPFVGIPIVKTYGSTIFTFLVMTIFIVFAVKPTVETIIVLQKKLDDSNDVLKKINQKANDLSLAKQNYDKLDLSLKSKISATIPDSFQLKSIAQILESAAKNHNASVSAFQIQPLVLEPKAQNSTGTISEIGFTFNVTGAYQNLVSILQDLKGSSRLISIDSLSLAQVNEGGGLIMSLSGKTYYIK